MILGVKYIEAWSTFISCGQGHTSASTVREKKIEMGIRFDNMYFSDKGLNIMSS